VRYPEVRIGCCVGLDKIDVVEKAGYDYIEPGVGAVMPERPESEFENVLRLLEGRKIGPEVWNSLMPGNMKLTGPNVDFYRIERYLRTVFSRIAKMGGKVVVFASGGARNIPDDFDVAKARVQILEFIALCGAVAGQHSLTIAIGSLTRRESNVINTVAEAVEFAETVARPEVKVLADLYYIYEELEPISHVAEAGSYLGHCHTADTGRYAPGSGAYDHVGFFRAMKEAGYDGRVSVECRWNNFENELTPALQFLQGIWESVNDEQ
jgi:sugar phosphate isomerase/epimerase